MFLSNNELQKIGFKSLGTNVLISNKVSIYGAEFISIGDNVRIDDFCILSGKITFGNNIHIGAGSVVIGGGGAMIMSALLLLILAEFHQNARYTPPQKSFVISTRQIQ